MPTPPPDRDSPGYDWAHKPNDHTQQGVYVEGPKGERNPLPPLQGFTHCRISAATPDGERKRRVAYRGREAQLRGDDDDAELEPAKPPTPRMVRIGNFWHPAKPANSGRKKETP